MAIEAAFNTLLFAKTDISRYYTGGLQQFRTDWMTEPGEIRCEDTELVAYSSMGWYFTKLIERLEEQGVPWAAVSESSGLYRPCSWVAVEKSKNSLICWKKDTVPGETVRFPWVFKS